MRISVCRDLAWQTATVERALRARSYPDEAAAAWAAPGASAVFELRPLPLNRRWWTASSTAAPAVTLYHPRWQYALHAFVDRELESIPWHVTARLPRLLALLPPAQRTVLEACCRGGRSYRDVALAYGTSKSRVARIKAAGLTRLACALWDDSGQPVYEVAA